MSNNKYVSNTGKAVAGIAGKAAGAASVPFIVKGLVSLGLGSVAGPVGKAAGDLVVGPVVFELVSGAWDAIFGD